MKAVGIVVEYNPFHNGHIHHVQQAKERTYADIVVAVMSGSFLQRGEPAIVSKWTRTKMALESGVDLVIELPYAFATGQASIFANGAVSILEQLGVQYLCFGSENGQIKPFLEALQIKQTYETEIKEEIRKQLKTGVSYPKAMAEVWARISNIQTIDLSQPNNILGFHYVEAIVQQKSNMLPVTIPRIVSQYHDKTFASETIASATSIRKHLLAHEIEKVAAVLPKASLYYLQHYFRTYHIFHEWEHYYPFFKYKLLTMNHYDLEQIYEVEEGLEYRLLSHIQTSTSFSEFMQRIKTKRYTWTRLQRLCTHILTGTTKNSMQCIKNNPTSPYMRVLGMTQKGQKHLALAKKSATIPILSNGKKAPHPLFSLDIKASFTFASILAEPDQSHFIRNEQIQHPLRFDETNSIYV